MGSHYDKFIRSLKGWKCAIDEDGKKNCNQLPNFDFIMGGVADGGTVPGKALGQILEMF